ncbi:Trk system potassium transporter TrkA [Desulfopila sp. IMCC35006]|uniref:Trk system potassium transporter TrkA n=1 Tax=Desulfopila sp. IMCC35006 TaxID=2569542 RepID=UPI0010AD8CE6|nr:Trk system potassium transporter TrkA [Desulfopila sp. IMCC35006]TKB26230.1 Trk system potassium transporter TrkA [Desulfopila sp. IMCC35006]
MDILIYGTTEMSYLVASRLHQQHNITLLHDPGELSEKFANLDIRIVEGSGGDLAVLEKIETHKTDLFIACSALDEANIVACWTIKKIVDTETICFIGKASLYKNFSSPTHSRYHVRYDIDSIIWPEKLLTQDIFRIISVPEALDVEYLAGGKAKLFEYRIKEGSSLINTSIKDCHFPQDVLIPGITRDGKLFIPKGNTTILYGDKVFFIGFDIALDTLAADFFKHDKKVKTVSIIGGGSVGFMLAEKLERTNKKVKIIEQNPERCEFLANSLKKTLVLQGNGTDLELLESESIAAADACICTTNNDEKNLLCSLLIKQLGSKRIVTRVGNIQNYELFEHVGIDVVVSPKASALTEVLNRVQVRDVNVLAILEGGKGEVLRLTLPDTFKEVQIKDLKLTANAIIGVIIRGHKVLIPNGDTLLLPGDRLKIFTMKEDSEMIKEFFFR